nr:hypothetical protein [Roseobacter litoralis]
MLTASFGPGSGHTLSALTAFNKATKGKVFIKIGTGRWTRALDKVSLNLFVCGETDQRLMVPFAQGYAPLLCLHITSINRVLQNFSNLPSPDFTVRLIFRKVRLTLKETLHFRLRPEAASRIAFQRFTQTTSYRLIRLKQLPMDTIRFEFIPNWGVEHPVALLNAGSHLLNDLATVLLALQLTLRSEDCLDKNALWRVFKIVVETLNQCAPTGEFFPKHPMEFRIAGEPFQIIKNDNVGFAFLGFQIGEHCPHTWPIQKISATRCVVREDHFDIVALGFSILTATMLLAFKARALCLLLCR